ncbi:MAG: hypothetical protein ABIM50_09445 [Novosphingobium sp.]
MLGGGLILLAAILWNGDLKRMWPVTGQSHPPAQRSKANQPTAHPYSATLLATLQRNFALATQGIDGAATRMPTLPDKTNAGIVCLPSRLTANASQFQIILPVRKADRMGTLAVILPDGTMRIIYVGYGAGVNTEDIVIPSETIDWESAKNGSSFAVDARTFNALIPNENEPELLFHEAGIYQFALLNAADRELLEMNHDQFRVKSGCVVEWQP